MEKVIRIDEDKGLTKLLRKRKKYRDEYYCNLHEQGLFHLVLAKFTGVFFNMAVAQEVMNIFRESLKEEKRIRR